MLQLGALCYASPVLPGDMVRLLNSVHLRAVGAFALLAIAFSWPLPAQLGTRLLAPVGSDAGVYVWNLWVFSHELLEDGHLPLFTSAIFSLDWQANLSLHNYTIFADVLAVPLLPLFGIVCAFNLLTLATLVVNGYAMFLLARTLGIRAPEAWLAGALFALSPSLVARSTEHLSLFMAAPLALFALTLHRFDRGARLAPSALAAGAIMAWATFCDPYYGVYCAVLLVWHALAHHVAIDLPVRRTGRRGAVHVLDLAIALLGVLTLWIAVTGGWSGRVLGLSIAMRTLYTPVLVLTAVAIARAWTALQPTVAFQPVGSIRYLLRAAPYAAFSCVLLTSPLLYALAARTGQGRYVSAPVLWRSSMPGLDVLSFFLPNPNHPLFRAFSERWLTRLPGGFVENVGSLPLTALIVVGAAAWWARLRPSKYWLALAVFAVAVAAGPFVRIAGVMTYVPTPWTLLRYAPMIGAARAPARFLVVALVALSVLFALALQALGTRYPGRRRWMLAMVSVLLLVELLPAPRRLYSAEVPSVYRVVAADRRPVRVLELPFGVRDGLSSHGNFTAASQFYQTFHRKRLIGGYLSRVSHHRVDAIRRRPVLNALIALSEGRAVPAAERERLRTVAPDFVTNAQLGYVVVDPARASDDLVRFAVDTLDLELVAASPERQLYRPRGSGLGGASGAPRP